MREPRGQGKRGQRAGSTTPPRRRTRPEARGKKAGISPRTDAKRRRKTTPADGGPGERPAKERPMSRTAAKRRARRRAAAKRAAAKRTAAEREAMRREAARRRGASGRGGNRSKRPSGSTRERSPLAVARRKQRRRIRIGVTAFILLVGAALILLAFLPAFYLKDIEVRGTRLLREERVIRQADLTADSHLLSFVSGDLGDVLRLRYGRTETKLKERVPLIEDVKVYPRLPSTVVIDVKESIPTAYMDNGNALALANRDGRIIATSHTKPASAPLIQGVITREYRAGDRMITDDQARYEEMMTLTEGILLLDKEANDGHRLADALMTMRLEPEGGWTLYVHIPEGLLRPFASDVGDAPTPTVGPAAPEERLGSREAPVLVIRTDRGAPGLEDLGWFRDALLRGTLTELRLSDKIEQDAVRYPGVLDLYGDQRSYRGEADDPETDGVPDESPDADETADPDGTADPDATADDTADASTDEAATP